MYDKIPEVLGQPELKDAFTAPSLQFKQLVANKKSLETIMTLRESLVDDAESMNESQILKHTQETLEMCVDCIKKLGKSPLTNEARRILADFYVLVDRHADKVHLIRLATESGFRKWIDAKCVLSAEYAESSKNLWDSLQEFKWANPNGLPIHKPNPKIFAHLLRAWGCKGDVISYKGKATRIYKGIKLL